MANQENLKKNTDSKAKLSEAVLVSVYLVIWAFSLLVFWLFMDGSDAMGYSLVFLWLLLPVTTAVLSVLIGRNDNWGRWKWASCVGFGVMYMLAEYGTFSLANMVAFRKLNMPDFGMLLVGAGIALAGMVIGIATKPKK